MATKHKASGEIIGRVVEIKTRDAGTRKLVDVLLEIVKPATEKYPEKRQCLPAQCWDLDTFCGEEASVLVGDTIQAQFVLGSWAKQGDKGTWYNLQCTLLAPFTILERAKRDMPAQRTTPAPPRTAKPGTEPRVTTGFVDYADGTGRATTMPASEALPRPPADDDGPVDDIPF